MTRHPLLLLLPLLLALSGCDAPTLGPDEDGDGLTAAQEERFGTDPRRPDTDGDGLLDGADPSPTPGLPALTLELLAVREEQASWAAELQAVVRDHLGAALEVEELAGTSSLGQLAPFVRTARTGVWTSRLVSAERGLAEVRACLPAAQGGGCSHPLQVSLCPGLPQPGLNPGAGVQGAFNGSLQVFALDGRTVGSPDRSPDPVPGAYVQLRLADGSLLEGQTDSCGSLVLRDRRLAGEPVTVTVASPGRRYVTFCDVRARIVAADLHPLDPIAGQGGTGAVAGVITGFLGEHVPPFPPTDNPLEELNVAIVHAAFRNEKLSSLSISNVLEMPDAQSSLAGMPIPSNMVVYSSGAEAPFTLPNLPPGEHLIFALAGRGKGVLETLEDPYMLRFTPLALGVATVTVEAGVTRGGVEIPLTVDLGPTSSEAEVERILVDFGELPPDPLTRDPVTDDPLPMPMGLLMPILDTGGRGFLFTAVDARYNFDDYTSPLETLLPRAGHPGLPPELQLTPRLVGLAGRRTFKGADPPGISTAITVATDSRSRMAGDDVWLDLPRARIPAPPAAPAAPDAVGADLEGVITWGEPERLTTFQRENLLYVVRLGYLTPPPASPAPGYTIGNGRSHPLWDLYVPHGHTTIELPTIPEGGPDWPPQLRNPSPSTGQPTATFAYDAETLEIELNACVLGAFGKSYSYDEDFHVADVNLHASHLSQDSYLVRWRHLPEPE